MTYKICLVIKNDEEGDHATAIFSRHGDLEEASAAFTKLAGTIVSILTLEPGQSYTLYVGDPENKKGYPPSLVGAGEENQPVF